MNVWVSLQAYFCSYNIRAEEEGAKAKFPSSFEIIPALQCRMVMD